MFADITPVRYAAIVELVKEMTSRGEQPKPEWLDAISTYQAQQQLPSSTSIAPPPPPPTIPPAAAPPPPPSGDVPRASVPHDFGERVQIQVTDNIETVVDQVLAILAVKFLVFQMGGRLLELQTDPGDKVKFLAREVNSPSMMGINAARARSIASNECRFVSLKSGKNGVQSLQETFVPEWLGQAIVNRPFFPHIPVLSAVAQAPTLRPDGALIREPGYDASTGIYLVTDVKVNVPENPTREDAQAAFARLVDLMCDFDFTNPAGPSVWVAGLLSVTCRHTFTGPAPFFIFDASKRGSGKTKLADMISAIATGASAPKMVYTDDDVEMDKRITALAISGDQLVCIDNIVGMLASPPLDMALTSTTYKGRVLGKVEMTPAMSMKIVWFATGNGMIIGADMARRALLARLEPQCDHPEERTGPRPGMTWKYGDIVQFLKDNRERFLSDCLTLAAAYIRAGRPQMGLRTMGSFEGWCDTIRNAVVWSGGIDPCDTIKDAQAADLPDQAQRAMVECWPVEDGVQVTAATLIEWGEVTPPLGIEPSKREAFETSRTIRQMWRNALLDWLPAKKGELPTAHELGKALRYIDGAVIGDFKIVGGKHMRSGKPWARLRVIDAKPTDPSPSPSALAIIK